MQHPSEHDTTPCVSLQLTHVGQRLFGQGQSGWLQRQFNLPHAVPVRQGVPLWYCREIAIGRDENYMHTEMDVSGVLLRLGVQNHSVLKAPGVMRVWIPKDTFDKQIGPHLDYRGPGRLGPERYAQHAQPYAPNQQQQALLRQEAWKRTLFQNGLDDWQEDPDARVYRFTGTITQAMAPLDIEALFARYGSRVACSPREGIRVPSADFEEQISQRLAIGVLNSNVHVLRHAARQESSTQQQER